MKNTRPIEYQIGRKLFDTLLKTKKKADAKENPYHYVMKILNEQAGLRGTVTKLFIIED